MVGTIVNPEIVLKEGGASTEVILEEMEKLSRDLRVAAATLGRDEARYMVDVYYQMQEQRIRGGGQIRAANADDDTAEPHQLIRWTESLFDNAERNLRRMLQGYAEGDPVGRWALSVKGIGPVLSAGILAHVDIEKAPTVGHIWRFAGLDPTVTWNKGQKRPWNADLKVICWRIGESFVKVQNYDDDVYGHIYRQRKDLEQERNVLGAYAEQAAASLAAKNWRDGTATKAWYEKGMLPPARIHLRATRYAVKLYLAHWHHVAYETRFHAPPPKPYVIEHLGHAHYLAPPNWPMQ